MTARHWTIAGAGAAGLAILAAVLMGRPGATVSADEPSGSDDRSFFSRWTAPREKLETVPAGSRVAIRLEHGISTEKNTSGDEFTASLDGPLSVNGKVLAPKGSKVTGLLTDVTDAGRVEGRASVTMVLRRLTVGEEEYTLSTQPLTFVAKNTKNKDAGIIAGSAAAGAVIGAIAGGGKGAAIGAGVGGGSGTGYVLATKGEPVAYGPETRFTFSLTEALDLPAYKN
jgi:hypothetical protein